MKRMLIFSILVFILAFVMTTEIAMPEDYPYRCPKMPEEYHKIPIEKPPPGTSNSIKALLGEWGGTWILISGVYLPIREARLKIYQIYPDKKFTVIYGCGNESGGWWTTRQAELQGNKVIVYHPKNPELGYIYYLDDDGYLQGRSGNFSIEMRRIQ